MIERAPSKAVGRAVLTPRESEVLGMIALGLANAEVAQRLDVTVHAVKFHLRHIYRKLGVTNRTEAAVACQLDALKANAPAANSPDGSARRTA